jgi:cobalt-zinc-cadmium efflux system membrane fusion protein
MTVKCTGLMVTAALAICSGGGASAAQPASQTPSQSASLPIGCIIEPDEVVEVGSPVIGVIQSIVKRGDRVRKGDVLAVLRNEVDRAALVAAQSRAAADAEEKAAVANYEFSRQRRVRAEELLRKEFVSKQALDQAIAEDEIAKQKLAQAREQRRILVHEAALARQRLEERTIRSPISGIIVERYLTAGERVEEKPLVRVVKIDPLRVEAILPSSLYGTIPVGSTARILPEMPNAAPATATVMLVDKVLDAASGTFRIRLQLPNSDGAIPAGLRCKSEFAALAKVNNAKAADAAKPGTSAATPKMGVVPASGPTAARAK